MTAQEKLNELKESLKQSTDRIQNIINFLEKHTEKIDEIGVDFSSYGTFVDFDNPTREQTVALQLYFGGTWKKDYLSEGIIYLQQIDKVDVRLYNTPPPPGCKIIEVKEWVEESVIPAYEKTTRKIECFDRTKTEQPETTNAL